MQYTIKLNLAQNHTTHDHAKRRGNGLKFELKEKVNEKTRQDMG